MNQTRNLTELQELSEKTGIEMVVINEASKLVGSDADHYRRRLTISHYIDDPLQTSLGQKAPRTKTVELPGISFQVEEDRAEQLIHDLTSKFSYRQCLAFISDRTRDGNNNITISVICTSDKFDIFRLQQTTGGTYLDSTENIIAGLQALHKKYPFNIIGTDRGWCLLLIKEHPDSWIDLAKEVMKICPSESTAEDWAKEIQKDNGKIFMWWD